MNNRLEILACQGSLANAGKIGARPGARREANMADVLAESIGQQRETGWYERITIGAAVNRIRHR